MNLDIVFILALIIIIGLVLIAYCWNRGITLNDVINAQNLSAYYSEQAREMYTMI